MPGGITVLRNADWVIAWDGKARRHVYLKGADVASEEEFLVQVGGRYCGRAGRSLDEVAPLCFEVRDGPLAAEGLGS